jgi:hypothetical protein
MVANLQEAINYKEYCGKAGFRPYTNLPKPATGGITEAMP